MPRLLLISYVALGAVLVATLAVVCFDIPYLNNTTAQNFSMNLATEVIGIGLTIFLVDRVIEKQREVELERFRQAALRRLRTALVRHTEFLFQMFKATVERELKDDLVEVSDLFNKNFFANVALLDFFKPAPISTALAGSLNWATYLAMESKTLNESLGRVLDKYSVYLDVELIELVERMLDKNFYRIVAVLLDEVAAAIQRGVAQPYPGFLHLTKHVVEPHVWAFQDLVHYFNGHVSDDQKITLKGQTWRNDVSPPVGSARAPAPVQ